MRKLSVCVPVFNEEGNVEFVYEALNRVSAQLNNYEFEYIFTDNHSSDQTWEIISKIASTDSKVKAVRFSRNFGFQASIMTGFRVAVGDAVIQIDADLQDPPELILDFVREWEKGSQVVYGVREQRSEGFFLASIRRLGYKVLNSLAENPIPENAGDFRLLDRRALEALLAQRHAHPYIRGIVAGLGFDQKGIPYQRQVRKFGASKFPIRKILDLGFSGIINHSVIPLRLASYAGAAALFFSFFAIAYSLSLYFLQADLPKGFTSIQIIQLITLGLNSFFLGIIGEYVLRIYRILRNDPETIFEESINFKMASRP
jgi:dolichol-phosphate mannosyltransferase